MARAWQTHRMSTPVLVVAAAIVDDLDDPRELLAARRAVPARHDVPWLDADVRIVDRLADLSARLS